MTLKSVRYSYTKQECKIPKMDSIKKYTIKEKFDELPRRARSQAIKEACERMEISEGHLRKIWGYPMESNHEAKPSQLVVLAELLNCSVVDLINEPLPQTQS